MPFMKFYIPSPVFSPGKRPKHVLGQMLEDWCLMFIPFCCIQQDLCYYILHNIWALLSVMAPSDPFWGGRCIMCVLLCCFPLFWKGVCLVVRMGLRDEETHPELSGQCKYWAEYLSKLSLWVIVLQVYRILYSTCWQTHSLVLRLVKKSRYVLVGKKWQGKTFCLILRTWERKNMWKVLCKHVDEWCMSVHYLICDNIHYYKVLQTLNSQEWK